MTQTQHNRSYTYVQPSFLALTEAMSTAFSAGLYMRQCADCRDELLFLRWQGEGKDNRVDKWGHHKTSWKMLQHRMHITVKGATDTNLSTNCPSTHTQSYTHIHALPALNGCHMTCGRLLGEQGWQSGEMKEALIRYLSWKILQHRMYITVKGGTGNNCLPLALQAIHIHTSPALMYVSHQEHCREVTWHVEDFYCMTIKRDLAPFPGVVYKYTANPYS